MINLIYAKDLQDNIGLKSGGLLWRIKEELDYFKEKISNHDILVGKNTLNDIKSLKNNKFVYSSTLEENNDYTVLKNESELINFVKRYENSEKQLFVCGGAKLYGYFIKKYLTNEIYIDTIYETEIEYKYGKIYDNNNLVVIPMIYNLNEYFSSYKERVEVLTDKKNNLKLNVIYKEMYN